MVLEEEDYCDDCDEELMIEETWVCLDCGKTLCSGCIVDDPSGILCGECDEARLTSDPAED